MKKYIIEKLLNGENSQLNEIFFEVRNNKIYKSIIRNIKADFFVDDTVHGISHNERVATMACYIGIQEGLNETELKNLIYAAVYHDIGRKQIKKGTRGIGRMHGFESAKIIGEHFSEIMPDVDEVNVNLIQGLCIAHSVEDNEIKDVLLENNVKIDESVLKLANILKDADALDRVRLPHGRLDENYLRTNIAKKLTKVSAMLYRAYKKIEEKTKEENNLRVNEELSQLLFDGENYYLVRSLNRNDIKNIENGDGIMPKYSDNEEIGLREVLEHSSPMSNARSKVISMTTDPNIALNYNRIGLNSYVLIKVSREDIESGKIFSSGDYLVEEMKNKIDDIFQSEVYRSITDEIKEKIKHVFEQIDRAETVEQIRVNINDVDRKIDVNLVSDDQQYLDKKQKLYQARQIAKCKILNYYGIMSKVADTESAYGEISQYTKIFRIAYRNAEFLSKNRIGNENLYKISPMMLNALALVKQAEYIGENIEQIKTIEMEILKIVQSGKEIDQESQFRNSSKQEDIKKDLTIDQAFEIPIGRKIGYRDTNMQLTSIRLLAEMVLNKKLILDFFRQRFPNMDIEHIFENTLCCNQNLITRINNKGIQFGKNVNFEISDYNHTFSNEVSQELLRRVNNLSVDQLISIYLNGNNAPEVNELLIDTRESDERVESYKTKTPEARYIAEAIVEGYNWLKIKRTLTYKEKEKLSKVLLLGVNNENSLYTLYEAIEKTSLGKKFTENEIFAIIINIAIDKKLGDVKYLDLVDMECSQIQEVLLNNNDSLQTQVLPISIDLLMDRGKAIDGFLYELGEWGIDKEFFKEKNIKNIYIAKQIVDEYEFEDGIKIDNQIKAAIIKDILGHSHMKYKVYLSSLVKRLEESGFEKQDIYGIIINSAVNEKASEKDGLTYTDLIMNQKNFCSAIVKYKDEIETRVTEETIVTAIGKQLNDEQLNLYKQKLVEYEIENDFLDKKNIRNVYVAKQIVEGYNFEFEIDQTEKNSIIKVILGHSHLGGKNTQYLSNLVKRLEESGLKKQDIYGIIINSAVNEKTSEKDGLTYTDLIMNQKNFCNAIVKYKDEIETRVTEETIVMAVGKQLNDEQLNLYKQKLVEYEIETDFLEKKDIKNVYVAKQIVEGYNFEFGINQTEKSAIIKVILGHSHLGGKNPQYLSNLVNRLEESGFEKQDIYGIIINSAINRTAIKQSDLSYSKILMNQKYCCNAIVERKNEVQTKIERDTIDKAVKKVSKPKKVKSQDIVKVTMELSIEGSGGSEICDAVQSDYQYLMEQEKQKEGSEQDVPN